MSSTEPPPNSSNGSLFKYYYTAVKSAFRSLIQNMRSMLESVNVMSLLHRRPISSDTLLPVHVLSDHNLPESQRYQPNIPMRHGKTILSLTLQTVLPLALSSSSDSLSSYSVPAMVIAFTALSIAMLLRDAYPRAASTLDKVASVFAVMGFFLMTNAILPSHFKWIGWLAFALCMLASILSLVK